MCMKYLQSTDEQLRSSQAPVTLPASCKSKSIIIRGLGISGPKLLLVTQGYLVCCRVGQSALPGLSDVVGRHKNGLELPLAGT